MNAVIELTQDKALLGEVIRRLDAHNARLAPGFVDERVFAVARRGSRLVGGALGFTFLGALSVEVLWVDEPWRGHGVGRALMEALEAEAVRRGCRLAQTDTFAFQAPAFYEALGYATFATLPGYADGHVRHYLRKTLSGGGSR